MFDYGCRTPPHCRDREETGCIRPTAHVKIVGYEDDHGVDCSSLDAIVLDYNASAGRWRVKWQMPDEAGLPEEFRRQQQLPPQDTIAVPPSNLRVLAKQPPGVPTAIEWLRQEFNGKAFEPVRPPFHFDHAAGRIVRPDESNCTRQERRSITTSHDGEANDIDYVDGLSNLCRGLTNDEFDRRHVLWATTGFGAALGSCTGWLHWTAIDWMIANAPVGTMSSYAYYLVVVVVWRQLDGFVGFSPFESSGEWPWLSWAILAGAPLLVGPSTCARLLLLACAAHHISCAGEDNAKGKVALETYREEVARKEGELPDEHHEYPLELRITLMCSALQFGLGVGVGLFTAISLKACLGSVIASVSIAVLCRGRI